MGKERDKLDTIGQNVISSAKATARSRTGQPSATGSAKTLPCRSLTRNTPETSSGKKLPSPVPSTGDHTDRVSRSQPADFLHRQDQPKSTVKIRPLTQGEITEVSGLVPAPTMVSRSRIWQGQFPVISDHMIQSPRDYHVIQEENVTLSCDQQDVKSKNNPSREDSREMTENKSPEGAPNIRTKLQEAGVIPRATGSRSPHMKRKRLPSMRKSFSTDALRSKSKEISSKMDRFVFSLV